MQWRNKEKRNDKDHHEKVRFFSHSWVLELVFWENVFLRSSLQEVFYKEGVLRSFAKFTRKHLCQSLFFNKVAGLAKFLRTLFLTEHLWVTASKVWKECRINFRFFSDWYFRIKFCFKCEIFFQFTPEILFMFLISLALTSGYTASIQLSIWRLVVV